eukprot:m.60480 g.60480  ORF g.60480 m.60480 type:complete len:81 (-) comp11819_c0_seq4:3997-4239(-)
MAEMEEKPVSAVLVGTGEYTTGYVHSAGSKSDKKIGVVGLCMFELRRLGYVHAPVPNTLLHQLPQPCFLYRNTNSLCLLC